MSTPSWLARLNDWFWHELPEKLALRSRAWAALAADGNHLSAWPLLGAGLPVMAGVLGLAIGVRHWGYDPSDQIVFLFSVPALLTFVVLGLQGAGVGVWAWLGFVFGDLVWTVLTFDKVSKPEMLIAGRLLQDVVLAGGLVGVPAAVAGLSRRLAGPERPGALVPLEGFLRAGLGFGLVWLWLLASAVQLQAVYTFVGLGAPTDRLLYAFASNGWATAMVAACAALARGMSEKAALRVPGYPERSQSLLKALATGARAPDLPVAAAALVGKAALLTFALSAVISSGTEALIVFGAIALILAVRTFGLGRFGLGAQIAALAPLPMRLAIAFVLVCGATGFFLERSWKAPGFTSALEAVLVALLLYALLLPEGAAARRLPAKAERRKAA